MSKPLTSVNWWSTSTCLVPSRVANSASDTRSMSWIMSLRYVITAAGIISYVGGNIAMHECFSQGDYTGQAIATDQNNERIFCVNLKLHLE